MSAKEYELLYMVPHTFAETDLPQVAATVEELIKKFGGENITQEDLGKKRLAYPIKNIFHGYYMLYFFTLEPNNVQKLYDAISLTDEIMRHIILLKVNYEAKTPIVIEMPEEKAPRDERRKPAPKQKEIIEQLEIDAKKKEVKKAPKAKVVADPEKPVEEAPATTSTPEEPIASEEPSPEEEPKPAKKEKKAKKLTMDDLDKTLEELTKIDESLL